MIGSVVGVCLGSRSVRFGLSFHNKPGRTPVLLLRFTLGAELLLDFVESRKADWIYFRFCIRCIDRLVVAAHPIVLDT